MPLPGQPITVESTTDLRSPISWTTLLPTNVVAPLFDYLDYDVKRADKPHKSYRARQP